MSAQRVKVCLSFVPLLLTFPDIDECSAGHTCDSSATCHNTDGSFTCVCDSGYSGDGYTCRGIVLDQLFRPQLFVSILKISKVFIINSGHNEEDFLVGSAPSIPSSMHAHVVTTILHFLSDVIVKRRQAELYKYMFHIFTFVQA